MPLRRYWIDSECVQGEHVELRGDTLHHIRDVCRQHVGSKFEVIVAGQALLVEIAEEAKNYSRARILETREIPPLPKPHIHLALCWPRFPVFETVLEKAVELGVHSIHPLYSEFSFIRKPDSALDKKQERWERIITSATQQCGRGERLQLLPGQTLTSLLNQFNRMPGTAGLFLYEGESAYSLKAHLQTMELEGLDAVYVFIGGEGGFSSPEVQQFQAVGLQSISLGEQILRVETACVAMLSILKYELTPKRGATNGFEGRQF